MKNTAEPVRIVTLQQLNECAHGHKCVVVPSVKYMSKPVPAAFVMNYQGGVLLRLFEKGMFVYETKKENGK